MSQRHYRRVTRYGQSAFLRAQLGPALALRGLSDGLAADAQEALRRVKAERED